MLSKRYSTEFRKICRFDAVSISTQSFLKFIKVEDCIDVCFYLVTFEHYPFCDKNKFSKSQIKYNNKQNEFT